MKEGNGEELASNKEYKFNFMLSMIGCLILTIYNGLAYLSQGQ